MIPRHRSTGCGIKSPRSVTTPLADNDVNKENQPTEHFSTSPAGPKKRRLFAKLSLDGANSLQSTPQLESLAIATCFSKRLSDDDKQNNALDTVVSLSDPDHYIDIADWFSKIKYSFHRTVLPLATSVFSTRKEEFQFFETFWTKSYIRGTVDVGHRNAALFVTGPPGCGKSAFVSEYFSSKQQNDKVKLISVNCIGISDSKRLCRYILDHFQYNEDDNVYSCIELLARELSISNQTIVLILDEIDSLFNSTKVNRFNDQNNLLLNLLKWSQLAKMNLVLVGIANKLDILDQWSEIFSPSEICLPNHCAFNPLSSGELMNLVSRKIHSSVINENITVESLSQKKHLGFHPLALELCCRKHASTGDIRKIFDILRLAIEIAEVAHVPTASISHLVTYTHIQKAFSPILNNISSVQIQEFPLQHQVILLAILLLEKEESSLSIQSIYLKYQLICSDKSLQVPVLDYMEFCQVVYLLESKNLLTHFQNRPTKSKPTFTESFQLKISKDMLIQIISSIPIFSSFVQT